MSIDEWQVDLQKMTVTGRYGLVFVFEGTRETGYQSRALNPEVVPLDDIENAARIANEAAEAFLEALNDEDD